MGSVRRHESKGTLFLDFRFAGQRLREYTTLADTVANRKRLVKVLERIETEIAVGSFDYQKTFGKPLPVKSDEVEVDEEQAASAALAPKPATPPFKAFAEQWYSEAVVSWRRSYAVTQRGALEKYLIPFFADKEVGQITKADVLAFRASLAKVTARKSSNTLSNRRINSVMKPLRQILNEAADRFEFTSAFRNIKPLKMKRSDVMPFSLEEVQRILTTVRADYRQYFTLRFFTGMRTGEVHGLKWKYIDLATAHLGEYVFCTKSGKPIDNQNFLNRVWAPLLRHLGLAHRRAYQMRHTAATLWLASGEAPEWIARQLGHTSTEMLFRVYSRYVPNLTRRDGSAMERMLKQHLSITPVSGVVLPEGDFKTESVAGKLPRAKRGKRLDMPVQSVVMPQPPLA